MNEIPGDKSPDTEGKAPLDKIVAVRLTGSDWHKLEEEASDLGIGPTTLARMWILERLRQGSVSPHNSLGAIEHFLRQAYREGILLQPPVDDRNKEKRLSESVLLMTPREQREGGESRGAVFYGNSVIN